MSTSDVPAPPAWAGVAQFEVVPGESAENIERARRAMARLSPPPGGVVVLPELWATGFCFDRWAEAAAAAGDIVAAMREMAARYRALVAGSVAVGRTGRCYNTLLMVGPAGIEGEYRKQRLFGPLAEDKHFAAGRAGRPQRTGCGLLGALVCYDLRFAALASRQAAQGCGLIVVSAQWPAARIGHWRALLRARAIENQVYVAAANACGDAGGVPLGGQSMLIAPDGEVLAGLGTGAGEAGAGLSGRRLAAVRSLFNTAGTCPPPEPPEDKVVRRDDLISLLRGRRAAGGRVVFTNGCFDILHQGHVSYLAEARRRGDCLVVGLNSDASIRRIKGPDRPVNGEAARAGVLAALASVDYVTIFDEDTPLALINALLPDVLVKGADWPVEKIVGAKEVMAAGGTVVNIPMVEGVSTTGIIGKIRRS